ncbi:MAG: TAXI family TRAP transporter solute-binding subunit, partial [Pseudomonadales bacterium]
QRKKVYTDEVPAVSKMTSYLAAILVCLNIISPAAAQNADDNRERVNQGTVMVMGGGLTGTNAALVWDMASLFDNGYELRVVPMLGRGSLRTSEDILYLKGVDVGFVQADVLDFLTEHNIYPNIRDVLRYITVLFQEDFHVVARPGIETIQDLQGKKVAFGPSTSGTFMSSSVIFERLGIVVEALDLPFDQGLQQLRDGKIDAITRIAGAPARYLTEVSKDEALHLLEVPAVGSPYKDATLTSDQYPGLIPLGDEVKSISVSSVMAAYNWPQDSPRRKKVQRLVDTLFARLGELRVPPYHPKWKQVDLDLDLDGWQRWDQIPVPGEPQS